MNAVEFFKTVKRLCKNQGCDECPVCKNNTCMVMLIARLYGASDESIEETISKVEQWSKDHPVKTRQSEFLKMFPNAQMSIEEDVIFMCPKYIDESYRPKENCQNISCSNCKREYWLEVVSE